MSYNLEVFGRDLRDRVSWLIKEVSRLHEENERLLRENKTLREEATLARLFWDVEAASQWFGGGGQELYEVPSTVSRESMQFYQKLPMTFNVAEYFQHAEREDVSSDDARTFMLLFFREEMLVQKGTQIEKTGRAPYPQRIAQ